MIVIYRRRNRYNMEFCFLQLCFIGSKFHVRLLNHIIPHLSGRIKAGPVLLHLLCIQIITDNFDFSAKGNGNGHPHIAKPHKRELFFSVYKFFI